MCPEGRASLAECASRLQVWVAGLPALIQEGIERDDGRKLQRAPLCHPVLLETLLKGASPLPSLHIVTKDLLDSTGSSTQYPVVTYMGKESEKEQRFFCEGLAIQSCLTLCDPMDCSPPGSSVHGILQARILEWIAIPFSRESSQPTDQTWVFGTAGNFFII